jgi:hypothetical protein
MAINPSFLSLLSSMDPELENVPLFDWRLRLTAADEIIERVAAERKRSSASRIKAVKGLNLRGRRESIARLLVDVTEAYIIDCDDFETRNSPDKPPRRQEDVPDSPQGPETIPEAIRDIIENLEECQDCEDRSRSHDAALLEKRP